MKQHKRQEIFERWRKQNPTPKSELTYASPFELLVAVVLSAQATDVSVNKVTEQLFRLANTPQTFLELGETGLREQIRSIGLFNGKSANLMKTCRILVELHQGEVPTNRTALEALPGVGRKTANVILNTAFGVPTIAVDTHVFRVSNRTGIAPGKTVEAVEAGLMRTIPEQFQQDAHHWLILHGRYVCTARRPQCGVCIIAELCEFPDKTA